MTEMTATSATPATITTSMGIAAAGLIDELVSVTHRTSAEWKLLLRGADDAPPNVLDGVVGDGGARERDFLWTTPTAAINGTMEQFVWPDDMRYTSTNTISIVLYR